MKSLAKIGKVITLFALGLFLPISSAYASSITAGQIIINLAAEVGPLEQLATGAAFVIGVGFYLKAVYHLKVYGEARTMMAVQTSLMTPLTYMLVGTVFIYLPTAMDIMMMTTFGSTSILAYPTAQNSAYSQTISAVLSIIKLVGVVSFIRGWIILAKSTGQGGGGQGATFGKALTHIFGGLMAVNIVLVLDIMSNTTGITMSFS